MTDDQFNAQQTQLTQITDKLLTHDKQFEAINKRFDEQDKRFDAMDERFAAIENHARIFEFRVDDRFDTVEQSLAEIKATTDRVMNLLDGIAGRLDIDDTERVAQESHLSRVQETSDDHEVRITQLEKRFV